MSLKSRRITRDRHQVLQGTYSNGTWQVSLGELGARDCSLLCDVPLGDGAESRSGHTCAGAVNLHGWGGRREKAPAPRYRMILDGRGSHTTTTTTTLCCANIPECCTQHPRMLYTTSPNVVHNIPNVVHNIHHARQMLRILVQPHNNLVQPHNIPQHRTPVPRHPTTS